MRDDENMGDDAGVVVPVMTRAEALLAEAERDSKNPDGSRNWGKWVGRLEGLLLSLCDEIENLKPPAEATYRVYERGIDYSVECDDVGVVAVYTHQNVAEVLNDDVLWRLERECREQDAQRNERDREDMEAA